VNPGERFIEAIMKNAVRDKLRQTADYVWFFET